MTNELMNVFILNIKTSIILSTRFEILSKRHFIAHQFSFIIYISNLLRRIDVKVPFCVFFGGVATIVFEQNIRPCVG